MWSCAFCGVEDHPLSPSFLPSPYLLGVWSCVFWEVEDQPSLHPPSLPPRCVKLCVLGSWRSHSLPLPPFLCVFLCLQDFIRMVSDRWIGSETQLSMWLCHRLSPEPPSHRASGFRDPASLWAINNDVIPFFNPMQIGNFYTVHPDMFFFEIQLFLLPGRIFTL